MSELASVGQGAPKDDNDPELVWAGTVDSGSWVVQVWHSGDYRGQLRIWAAGSSEPFFNEAVGLSYGARFGPDVDDVRAWQERSVEVIDARITALGEAA